MIWIDGYPIDLAVSEAPTFTSEVTSHPIEKSSDASDHIRNLPCELELQCLVSDTPSGEVAEDATRQPDGLDVPLPAEDAYAKLIEIRDAMQPVTVECSFGIFLNMGMTLLSPVRDPKATGGLWFSVSFKQLTIIELKRVTVRVATPVAAPGKPVGKKVGSTSKGVPRRTDKEDGTWFDPDINAWREGASVDNSGQWTYFKGKVLGIPERGLTDAQYRDIIAKRRDRGLVTLKNKNGIPGPVSQADLDSGNFDVSPGQTFDLDKDNWDLTTIDTDEGAGYRPLDTPINQNPDGTVRYIR